MYGTAEPLVQVLICKLRTLCTPCTLRYVLCCVCVCVWHSRWLGPLQCGPSALPCTSVVFLGRFGPPNQVPNGTNQHGAWWPPVLASHLGQALGP